MVTVIEFHWVYTAVLEILRKTEFCRGLIAILDGLSIWLLAFLYAAYNDDMGLPWDSTGAVADSVSVFATRWLTNPLGGPVEFLASFGALLVILGPPIFWVLVPMTARKLHSSPSPIIKSIESFASRIRKRMRR